MYSLLIFFILTASNSLSIRLPEFSKIKLYVLAVLQQPRLDLRRRWVSQHVTQGFPSSHTTQLPWWDLSPLSSWYSELLNIFPKVSFSFSNRLSYMVSSQSGKFFSPLCVNISDISVREPSPSFPVWLGVFSVLLLTFFSYSALQLPT